MQIIHRYCSVIFLYFFATHTCLYGFDLHIAAACNNSSLLRLLIEQSADIDAQDEKKCTALHYASSNNHIEALNELLCYGCNVDIQDNQNNTALHNAARQGNTAAIKLLLDNRADTSIMNRAGSTPLHYAARAGSFVAVELLMNNGLEIEAADVVADTPLHCAIESQHESVACKIIERLPSSSCSYNKSEKYSYPKIDKYTCISHIVNNGQMF